MTAEPDQPPAGPPPHARLPIEPRLCSIDDAAQALGISYRLMKTLIDEGLVGSVKIGARRLVVVPSLDAYIAALLAYGTEPAPKRKRGRPRKLPRPNYPGAPWTGPQPT
jgi:hypothetical protein